jgi:hypothetical protein
LNQGEQRIQQTFLLCRIVLAQTVQFTRGLEQLDYRVGEPWLLLKTVDQGSIELGLLSQKRRDKAAAKRFFKWVLLFTRCRARSYVVGR